LNRAAGLICWQQLVLIAPSDSSINKVEIGPKPDLAKLLATAGRPQAIRIMCRPASTQRQRFKSSECGRKWRANLHAAADVRGALTLVERGEAPLGIVYSTDAAITPKVKVVGVFPADSHPKIVYPTALVAGKVTAAAKSFLEFLKTSEAKRRFFEKYGFTTLQ